VGTIAPLLIVIPIILGIFLLLFCFFAFKLYLEFGWKIYKKIGADPKMRSKIFSLLILYIPFVFVESFVEFFNSY